MKKVNPEDLVVGQEYYVKLHFNRIDTDGEFPAVFSNNKNSYNFIPINQPIYTADETPIKTILPRADGGYDLIYTADDQPQKPDPELEMLVNVATVLMINDLHFTENEIEEELGHKLSEDKKERAKQWASAYKKLIARDAADLIAACKKIKEVSND